MPREEFYYLSNFSLKRNLWLLFLSSIRPEAYYQRLTTLFKFTIWPIYISDIYPHTVSLISLIIVLESPVGPLKILTFKTSYLSFRFYLMYNDSKQRIFNFKTPKRSVVKQYTIFDRYSIQQGPKVCHENDSCNLSIIAIAFLYE